MAGTAFTVFVIDNDPTSLNRLTKVLRPTGYKIKKYPNPNTFLDEHDWTEPGCVLLNLYMKDLNGLQVQQRLAGQQLERLIIFLAARCTVEAHHRHAELLQRSSTIPTSRVEDVRGLCEPMCASSTSCRQPSLLRT